MKIEPVLWRLYPLVLGTAMLVPWNLRWQCWLSVAGLASFTIVSLIGSFDSSDFQRWLILASTMAVAASFIVLKKNIIGFRRRSSTNSSGTKIGCASKSRSWSPRASRLNAEVAERQAAERIASRNAKSRCARFSTLASTS